MTIIAIVEEAFFESSGISVLDRPNGPRRGKSSNVYTTAPCKHVTDARDQRKSDSRGDLHTLSGSGLPSAQGSSVYATGAGKRQLPDSLRVLLHANETVRHIEEELEERKTRFSRTSVDFSHQHHPFFR